jgi:acetyl esterase
VNSVDAIPKHRAFWEIREPATDVPGIACIQEDVRLRTRDGIALKGDVYVPEGPGPFPAFLYLHGGGFCVWSAKSVRRKALRLARSGFVVLSLDYGLAPESPFPWAVEDAVYAARWLVARGEEFSAVAGQIGIGGDSAGANLAASTIAFLAGLDAELDEGDLADVSVTFGAALLLYGVYDFQTRLRERSSGEGSTELTNLAYLGPKFLSKHRHPLVSPILAASLGKFPATYLSCGSADSVLPQSLRMTAALAEVGVDVTLSVVSPGDHEFLMLSEADNPRVKEEWERIENWLTRVLRSN